MNIEEKLATIQENEQKVFDAGKDAEWNEFWDAYQMNGTRVSYQYAFYHYGWTDETFKPKYDVVLDGGYTSNSACAHSRFTTFPVVFDVSKSKTDISSIFYSCILLKTIKKIIFSETNTFYRPFYECIALENITVGGTIGQNGLSFQWSPKLTKASITSIIYALSQDTNGLTLTLSKKAVNKAFETSEGANNGVDSWEWSDLRAMRSNWDIALV